MLTGWLPVRDWSGPETWDLRVLTPVTRDHRTDATLGPASRPHHSIRVSMNELHPRLLATFSENIFKYFDISTLPLIIFLRSNSWKSIFQLNCNHDQMIGICLLTSLNYFLFHVFNLMISNAPILQVPGLCMILIHDTVVGQATLAASHMSYIIILQLTQRAGIH